MSRWIGLVVPLLALTPATALADIISWNYQATLQSVGGDPRPGFGLGASPSLVDLGSLSIHDDEVGQLNGNSGSALGWRTVPLGSVTLYGEFTPDMTWHLAQGMFKLSLTLTDIASGESAVLNYSGRAGVTGDQVDSGGPFVTIANVHVTAQISPTDAQTITLGGNPYAVSVDAVNHPNGTAYLEADIHAGSINETPEPATLVSALVGIGAMGLVAGRRVSIRRPAKPQATIRSRVPTR
jgi:hypothetical protein